MDTAENTRELPPLLSDWRLFLEGGGLALSFSVKRADLVYYSTPLFPSLILRNG